MNPAEIKRSNFAGTMQGGIDRSELFTRLRIAAEMLLECGKCPEKPFVAYRQKDRSVKLQIVGELLTVGRRKTCGLAFADDAKLSGEHLRIFPGPTGHILQDQSSTNGTFINDSGEKVRELQLRDGDLIYVGNQILLFVNPAQSIPFDVRAS